MNNKGGRPMGIKEWEDSKIKKAEAIFEKFEEFSHGFRTLFLIQRHKEGVETNNSKLIKKVTRNSEEYKKALTELVSEKMESDLTLRIYACVNDRDFKKAIRQFKYEQMDADYFDETCRENFYLDIRNRFIGCLMQPKSRNSSLFLFDIDMVEGFDNFSAMLGLIPDELIVKKYRTKNGWHMITKPFNYTTFTMPDGVSMKKDGLLLLDY